MSLLETPYLIEAPPKKSAYFHEIAAPNKIEAHQ